MSIDIDSRTRSAEIGQKIVTDSGIGSDMDFGAILEAQLAAEFDHKYNALDNRKSRAETQLNNLDLLQSSAAKFEQAITDLADFDPFKNKAYSISDDWNINAEIGVDALVGNHNITIEQLASSHTLSSNQTYNSRFASLGSGQLTIAIGSFEYDNSDKVIDFQAKAGHQSLTLNLDASNNTLDAVATQINEASVGVTALVIDTGDGFKLSFTSQDTGRANEINITASNELAAAFNYNASSQTLINNQQAQNAVLTLNGVTVEKQSNNVDDLIAGVKLDLYIAEPGKVISLDIEMANDFSLDMVATFVDDYNLLVDNLDYYQGTGEEEDDKQGFGELALDTFTRELRMQMQRILASNTGGYGVIDAGIEFDEDLKHLTFNREQAMELLTNQSDDFNNIFASFGQTSDPLIQFDHINSLATPGEYNVEVTQLASQPQLSVALANAANVIINDDGSGSNSLTLKINGGSDVIINLDAQTYVDTQQLVTELTTKLNLAFKGSDEKVSVEYDGSNLSITLDQYGSAKSIEIVAVGASLADALNLSPDIANGEDVRGYIGGGLALGEGQTLTGFTGDGRDIALKVLGGSFGAQGSGDELRGTINYGIGIAGQLSDFIAQLDGRMTDEKDKLDENISSIDEEQEDLDVRKENRYLILSRQYAKMQSAIAESERTLEYLDAMFNSKENN